jgi:phosphoglycerate dehydrogenase-like enzyme
MRILFCHPYFSPQLSWEPLASLLPGHEIITCSREGIAEHLEGVDILVPFAAPITRSLIERGTFGVIHEFAVGLDTVDVEAATAVGVWVAHLPGASTGNADSVAELALRHLLLLSRRWKQMQATFETGGLWEPAGTPLLGKTACLVGMGDIGTAIARRLFALNMRLIGVRRRPEQGGPEGIPFQRISSLDAFPDMLSEADYVVLCLPATSETTHLFDASVFAAMKPGSFLINVGRGQLVDQHALLEALRSDRLAGAGLDVFWEEPVDPHHPLFRENVIATPHIGGITDTSFWMRAQAFAANIERYAQGQPLLYTVNQLSHVRVSPPLPRYTR